MELANDKGYMIELATGIKNQISNLSKELNQLITVAIDHGATYKDYAHLDTERAISDLQKSEKISYLEAYDIVFNYVHNSNNSQLN